jgi:predicted phosphodiesterase
MEIGRRQFVKWTAAGAGLTLVSGAGKGQPAQAAAETPRFTFAVVADPHCAEGPRAGLERYGTGVDKFLACVKTIEQLDVSERPDFMLLVGDVHPWALEEHKQAITIPVHAVAGNHESDGQKREQLRLLFPEGDGKADYYAFTHKGLRFIGVCNAGGGGEHIGQLCSEFIQPRGQCEWLEKELSTPDMRKIVFAHIPPEPEGRDRNMFLSRNDSRWFNQLVVQTKPEMMFFGHLHQPTKAYAIGAARCFNVCSCAWNTQGASIGFLLVHVRPEGLEVHEIETGRPV